MISFTKGSCQKSRIYDYKDSDGINVIHRWADKMMLTDRIRGRLDIKIETLERGGINFSPSLAHPVTGYNSIYHLVVKGKKTFCPMFCRGPLNPQEEFTFLFGAIEKDSNYIPENSPNRAESNRQDLQSNHSHRCNHKRFGRQK